MNTQEQQFQLIENYLAGKLPETASKAFDSRMAHNPMFKKEVMLHREIDIALKDTRETQLEAQLDSLGQKYFRSRPFNLGSFPGRNYRLMLAAVLALIIISAAGWLMMQRTSATDGPQLFTEYYEVYPGMGKVRAGDPATADDSLVQAAFQAYSQRMYTIALSRFQAIEANNASAFYASYYAGVCQLETGQHTEAISTFQQLIYKPGHPFVQQARWYLALALIKNGQFQMAKTQLETLRTMGGKYGQKARELLAKMG